jgi:acyl-CoA synthetase (AMP-forming)/AMP-acid ligase II
MFIDFLLERFAQNETREAIVWKDRSISYGELLALVRNFETRLAAEEVAPGTIVAIDADFSPSSVALFLALMERACVLVPLTASVEALKPEFHEIAEVELIIAVGDDDTVKFTKTERHASNALFVELRKRQHPGLILFSSGSTGKAKAAVHDLTGLLEKFKVPRKSVRAITFLLYDHIGGVNTLLYNLSNAGTIVTVSARTPEAVLAAVERHRVELLPTSPTFINLILISEAYRSFDLQTLRTVTYGTEPMPESTLRRFHELFPKIDLLQTYGLSEVGILRSKSRSSDSLWVKVGGEGFETRIVDGILHIRARSAMLGYLNAPSPFTDDGWFITGDLVEQDGEWLRICGRKSEVINVGGEKVHPAEVESVIQELDNVRDVTVRGEKSAITGQIVTARVTLKAPEPTGAFVVRLKKHCLARLQPFKVPVKVTVTDEEQHGGRFKRMRGGPV